MVLHRRWRGWLAVVRTDLLAVHHPACFRGFAFPCIATMVEVEQLDFNVVPGSHRGVAGWLSCCLSPRLQRHEKEREHMTPNRPAAPNAGIEPDLTSGHDWHGDSRGSSLVMRVLSDCWRPIETGFMRALRILMVALLVVLTTGCSTLIDMAFGGSDRGWVKSRSEYYQKRGVDPNEARSAARWDFRSENGRFPDD